MGQSDDAVGTVMCNAPIVIQCDQAPMSATVSKMERRSKPRDHGVFGNWDRVNLAGWVGARHQFGIHEVVHILTVLAVLPGQALLDGPCG